MIQFLANGLCSGAVYALVAVGFGLIFIGAKTFHIAHGAVYTAAAYTCYALLAGCSCPLAFAVAAGVGAGMLLGVLVECLVYYPLVDLRRREPASPMVVMISSLGAYIVVVNVIALLFGNETKLLRLGVEDTITIGGAILTYVQLAQVVAAATTLALLWLFMKRSRFGRSLRALADDAELISVLGYDVRKLRLGVFGIGSLLAAAGGILSALDVGVDPHVGLNAILVAAVAAILGGAGKVLAPALGALIIGILQSIVVWQTSAKWASAVVFALLILVLIFRPQGILAHKLRTEEQ